MNSNDGVNAGIFLGQIDCTPTALDGSADRDDARDTGLGGAAQDIIEVAGEIRIIEMRVSFDQHNVEGLKR
jgi:hypothetical protein